MMMIQHLFVGVVSSIVWLPHLVCSQHRRPSASYSEDTIRTTLRQSGRRLQNNVAIDLVTASTGNRIVSLVPDADNGAIVVDDLADLTIVADAPSATYVKFGLSGGHRKHEGRAPYAMCGDVGNVLTACDFWNYDQSYKLNAKLSTGETIQVSFQLVKEEVTEEPKTTTIPTIGYNLVDTSSTPQRVLIPNIQTGARVPIGRLSGATQLTVSVVPSFDVGALKFDNGIVEARFPFSSCGDVAGVFRDCFDAAIGTHSFSYNVISPSGSRISKESFEISIVAEGAEEKDDVDDVDDDENKAVATQVSVPSGGWQLRKGLPLTARHEACFVWVGDKAYLIGGRRNPMTDIYDPASETWSNGKSPPIQLHHMQCVVVNDTEIWIVAAWTGTFPREKTPEDIHIYNTKNDRWSTKPGLPEDRRRGSAAVILANRRIYVSHGNKGGHATTKHSDVETTGYLDYYDLDRNVWVTNLPDAPNPRDHTGGAFLNDRYICVAGGRNGSILGWPMVAATDCFDTVTNRWTTKPSLPLPRSGSSYGTSCDGKWLLVAGGESGDSVFDEFHAFDGDVWTSLASLRDARHGSSLAVDCTCNQIFLASGSGGPRGGPELSSMETLGSGC